MGCFSKKMSRESHKVEKINGFLNAFLLFSYNLKKNIFVLGPVLYR